MIHETDPAYTKSQSMTHKKKIVIGITASASTILIKGQMKHFADQGYDVYLIAPEDQRTIDYCRDEGGTLLPVTIERDISIMKDLSSLRQVLRHFRKVKPDVVNVGTPKIGLLGMVAAKLTGVPVRIYTCRGFRFEHEHGFKKKILVMMESMSGRCAQKIICISPSLERLSHELGVFAKSKTVVINKGSSNGIDIARFSPDKVSAERTQALKRELGLDGKFVYGFVGRLVDRKGITETYQAFNDLYNANQNLRFIFVGGIEQEQIADKTLIDKIKTHPGMMYLGPQQDVPLYLSLMDVFVLPAWWEGFGNVLVQAAAMGVPVISTKATGCRDAVSDGYNGMLIEPKNVPALKDAMTLLYNDDGLREKYGRNGVEWAKNFDSVAIWEAMKKLYKL